MSLKLQKIGRWIDSKEKHLSKVFLARPVLDKVSMT